MPRIKGDKSRQSPTMLDAVFRKVDKAWETMRGSMWPCEKWQSDPVGFVREVLGVTTIFPWQADILEGIRDCKRVSVRSGQKCCKTTTLVWAALWWYCSFPGATVVLTASTADQIRTVDWKQLTKTLFLARKHGLEIEDASTDPARGMAAPDGRMLYGFTARDVDSAAGISAPHILFLVDEASALTAEFAEAIEGNTAGGDCRILYISNPIRTEGPFFASHHADKERWKTFHLSSEKVAEYCDARGIRIAGVAHGETIREWERFYGRDSQFFQNRALGEFVQAETGRIINVGVILAAQQRENHPRGALKVGIDPAGDGDAGDEWGFAIVRGNACIKVYRRRGLTIDAGIAELDGILKEYREGDETPQVNIDSEGKIGAQFHGRLAAESGHRAIHNPKLGFDVYGVKSGSPATREPNLRVYRRDEMWANMSEWLRSGSIPSDIHLETELHAPMWIGVDNRKLPGQVTCTNKKELRKKLGGRSPDTADALVLAVWDATPYHIETAIAEGRRKDIVAPQKKSTLPEGWGESADIDVYDAAPYGGGIDPYK